MRKLTSLTPKQKHLRRRILEIIFDAKASHIGSCLSVIDLIQAVYEVKRPDEKFVLSNGHAAVALYAVLEDHGYLHSPNLHTLNIHPDRNADHHIDLSTGSLGQGLPIALGMALADRQKNVYCSISDGEMAEGSIWESLRIASDLRVHNLRILVSANGWGAYDPISLKALLRRIKGFGFQVLEIDGHDQNACEDALRQTVTKPTVIFAHTNAAQLPFLVGLDAHYYSMTPENFELALQELQ